MYFGSHGQVNGLDTRVQAMALLPKGAAIRLRMIGDGPLKPALMAQAAKSGLDNIIFEPQVPKNQISSLAAQADTICNSCAQPA